MPVQRNTPRAEARVVFQNEVRIQLPPVNVAGNEWVVVKNDTRYLRPLRAVERQPDGGYVAPFVALREGRRAVRFFELPPGRRKSEPAQTYEVVVEIE